MIPLPWDSEFFGLAIGRADLGGEPVGAVLEQARTARLDCVYLFAGGSELAALDAAIGAGARLVDLRNELDAELATLPESDGRSRRAGSDERGRVEEAAARLSAYSRFRRDPRFPAERVAEMYRHWARLCLDDGVVVVPADGGDGLVGVRVVEGVAHLELVYVGPAASGRGLGHSLVAAGLREAGVARARVVTQAGNVGALRLYQATGFRTRSLVAVLHLWLDEAA